MSPPWSRASNPTGRACAWPPHSVDGLDGGCIGPCGSTHVVNRSSCFKLYEDQVGNPVAAWSQCQRWCCGNLKCPQSLLSVQQCHYPRTHGDAVVDLSPRVHWHFHGAMAGTFQQSQLPATPRVLIVQSVCGSVAPQAIKLSAQD